MTTLWRLFIASWKHIVRNGWMTLATIFVLVLALLSVNVLIGVQAMMGNVVTLFEEKIDAVITFKTDTPEAIMQQARSYLADLPQTADVQFVSPEEALVHFRARHEKKQDARVLSALNELGTNPFGAQLVLKAKRTDGYAYLLEAIHSPQYEPYLYATSYDDHALAIASIRHAGEKVQLFGSFLVALFALFGMMVAFNAIRVAIYAEREEIGIMRLVGASSAYIRGPFLLEGVWIACLSLLVCGGLVWASLIWLEPGMRVFFDGGSTGLPEFFARYGWRIAAMESAALLFVTTLVSWLAVGRYIKR